MSKVYDDKLFELVKHILPAVIASCPPDASVTEIVDLAVEISRSTLSELIPRQGATRG